MDCYDCYVQLQYVLWKLTIPPMTAWEYQTYSDRLKEKPALFLFMLESPLLLILLLVSEQSVYISFKVEIFMQHKILPAIFWKEMSGSFGTFPKMLEYKFEIIFSLIFFCNP